MSIYSFDLVITTSKEIIPLIHIESFRFGYEDADERQTLDRLIDDVTVSIITLSGREYTISMKDLEKSFPTGMSGNLLAASVYQRWIWVLHST